ncbi:hypothetical protein I4U23_016771 [Adineta vaga]|nr:hypothetical protein I4U23_016771 [Adineta vaga]
MPFFQWISELNLFETNANDVDSIRIQLAMYTAITEQTIRIDVINPSLGKVLDLQQQTNLPSLECLCSQLSTSFQYYIELIPSYHEICFSDFVSDCQMKFIYHILLFIICFGSFVHCQGARSSGSRHLSGSSYVRSSIHHQTKTCHEPECRFTGALIISGIIAIVVFLILRKVFHDNSRCENIFNEFLNDNINEKITSNVNVFPSGIWLSQYYQNECWHGLFQFRLIFSSSSSSSKMKIKEIGSDDVGIFDIKGKYLNKTKRIVLIKEYRHYTTINQEKLGHRVIIKLKWNEMNNQFEGDDSNNMFDINTTYSQLFNNYLTREVYSDFLSTINDQTRKLFLYENFYSIFGIFIMIIFTSLYVTPCSSNEQTIVPVS